MSIFLQAFFDGFTFGSLLSWAEMPDAADQVFADGNSDYPQFDLTSSLIKEQQAKEEQGMKNRSIFNDDFFASSTSLTETQVAEILRNVGPTEYARAVRDAAFGQFIGQSESLAVSKDADVNMEDESTTEGANTSMSGRYSRTFRDVRIVLEAIGQLPPGHRTASRIKVIHHFLSALREMERETHGA